MNVIRPSERSENIYIYISLLCLGHTYPGNTSCNHFVSLHKFFRRQTETACITLNSEQEKRTFLKIVLEIILRLHLFSLVYYMLMFNTLELTMLLKTQHMY